MTPSLLNMLFLTFVFSILPTSHCSECLNICVYKESIYWHPFSITITVHTCIATHCRLPSAQSQRIVPILNLFLAFSPRGKEPLRSGAIFSLLSPVCSHESQASCECVCVCVCVWVCRLLVVKRRKLCVYVTKPQAGRFIWMRLIELVCSDG